MSVCVIVYRVRDRMNDQRMHPSDRLSSRTNRSLDGNRTPSNVSHDERMDSLDQINVSVVKAEHGLKGVS
jgi:hypothetical protein